MQITWLSDVGRLWWWLMRKPVAISIGNFDGVHAGHQALVKKACQAVSGGSSKGQVVVLAFDPHPASILRPEQQPDLLTPFSQRVDLLRAAGVDEVHRLVPTPDLLGMSPKSFIESVVAAHQPSFFIEGPDFRFGKGRAGSIETLELLGHQHGFGVEVAGTTEVVLSDRTLVPARSSLVRWLLSHGRVADAALVLGRPYQLTATVEPGDKQGRLLGCPTANCGQVHVMLPADGVYTGLANDPSGNLQPAAISVGSKPTFGGHQRLCEVHLIDYEGDSDVYDWPIQVQFKSWIREQRAFGSEQQLMDQMARDIDCARSRLESMV